METLGNAFRDSLLAGQARVAAMPHAWVNRRVGGI